MRNISALKEENESCLMSLSSLQIEIILTRRAGEAVRWYSALASSFMECSGLLRL